MAHERFIPYSFTSIQKKISCLEVWKKRGKVRENDSDEKMATLYEHEVLCRPSIIFSEFHVPSLVDTKSTM